MTTEGIIENSLCVGWCDNGFTDSLFTSSLTSLMLHLPLTLQIESMAVTQTIGNQIARQRSDMLQEFEKTNHEWLLWLDSDIVISAPVVKMLWDIKDKVTAPVVCGVYFVSMEPNQPLMMPFPCIFTTENRQNKTIHPLPENEIIDIDVAGLGFCLMHRSVADKLRQKYGNTTFQIEVDDIHISEDVSFFWKLKELGIPVKAHTGALVQHIKRFVFDINYYNLWWNVVAPMREAQEKASDNNL